MPVDLSQVGATPTIVPKLVPYRSDVLFLAGASAGETTLWRATPGGRVTRVFSNPPFDESTVGAPGVADGDLYFGAVAHGAAGADLWRLDDRGGLTRLTRQSVEGTEWRIEKHRPGRPVVAVRVLDVGVAEDTFAEIWTTDGTQAGTRLVKSFPNSGVLSVLSDFTWVGDQLFFTALHHDEGPHDLWVTDGTPGGTRELTARLALYNPDDGARHLTAMNGRLYFSLDDDDRGTKLWRTDGTVAGTRKVSNLGTKPKRHDLPYALVAAGRKLYFGTLRGRPRLWVSNGTASRTRPISSRKLSVWEGIAVKGRAFFRADGGKGDRASRLVVTDGTARGTRTLVTFPRRAHGIASNSMVQTKGRVYFLADDGVHGMDLWTSDGTARGTRLVADTPGKVRVGKFPDLVAADGTLWHSALLPEQGAGLWRTRRDRSVEGPRLTAASAQRQRLPRVQVTGALAIDEAARGLVRGVVQVGRRSVRLPAQEVRLDSVGRRRVVLRPRSQDRPLIVKALRRYRAALAAGKDGREVRVTVRVRFVDTAGNVENRRLEVQLT